MLHFLQSILLMPDKFLMRNQTKSNYNDKRCQLQYQRGVYHPLPIGCKKYNHFLVCSKLDMFLQENILGARVFHDTRVCQIIWQISAREEQNIS